MLKIALSTLTVLFSTPLWYFEYPVEQFLSRIYKMLQVQLSKVPLKCCGCCSLLRESRDRIRYKACIYYQPVSGYQSFSFHSGQDHTHQSLPPAPDA